MMTNPSLVYITATPNKRLVLVPIFLCTVEKPDTPNLNYYDAFFLLFAPDIIMKTAVLSPLLCLISVLVEVNLETFPLLMFNGTTLPNHTYMDFNLVGNEQDTGVECHTDLPNSENRAMDWYFPSGKRLHDRSSIFDIYVTHKDKNKNIPNKNVQVRRKRNPETSGIYRCDTKTSAVNNGNRETIYAGLYSIGGEWSEGFACISALS